ncbi:hypothetical protein [Bacteriovorax stolpii]|uniref:hypothetical protein n=1 Tax=Bacteriovorax stolpii TaxID=960 RepID=UPI00115B0867|nr:hypothetical protein [Bacteriovorax stolpii]
MNKLLSSLLLLVLYSCSTATLTPEAKKLIILNDVKYVLACTQVAFVNASSSMSNDIAFTAMGNNDSMIKLKNMAAKFGNVLVLTKNKESAITGSDREGYVYKCPDHIVFVQTPVKK